MNADELEEIACRAAAAVSKRVGDLEPLEDLQQEARMAVLLALLTYRQDGMDIRGYLWVKARNACIDYVRALHGKPGDRPATCMLDHSVPTTHDGFEAVDQKDSTRKARRIQRMQDNEKPERKPTERVGSPGKPGGPVTVCGILFERVSNGVLMTLPSGQTASCSLLHFQHAMALLLGPQKK